MAEMASVSFADFGDGLNTEMPAMKLTPSEATVAYNLRSVGGVLMPRKAVAQYDNIAGETAGIHSLAIFTTSSAEKYMLAGCGNKIWGRKIASTPWWHANWNYRIPITITNLSDITETDYIEKIVLDITDADALLFGENGKSIRFCEGMTVLKYRVEHWRSPVADGKTLISVKLSIGGKSTKTIYLYFGNATVASASEASEEMCNFYQDCSQPLINVSVSGRGHYSQNEYGITLNTEDHWHYKIQFLQAPKPPCNIKARMVAPSNGDAGLYYCPTLDNGSLFVLPSSLTNFLGGIYFGGSGPIGSLSYGDWCSVEILVKENDLILSVYNASNSLIWTETRSVGGILDYNNNNVLLVGLIVQDPCYSALFSDFYATRYNKDIRQAVGVKELQTNAPPWAVLKTMESSAPWVTTEIVDATQKKKIVFANGGYCVTWDGGSNDNSWKTWSSATGLRHPVKYVVAHKGRLFGAYATDGGVARLFYCNVNERGEALIEEENDWRTYIEPKEGVPYWIENCEDLGNGSPITGLVPNMFDSLLFTTEENIGLLYGSGPGNWGEKMLPYPYGCVAPRSLVKYQDTLFFCSDIGIHYIAGEMGHAEAFTFDNIKADSLSEKIKRTVPTFERSNAFGVVWDNKYYLFFPSSVPSAAHPSICLVLDWRRKSWWLDSELDYDMVSSVYGQGAPPASTVESSIASSAIDTGTDSFYVGGIKTTTTYPEGIKTITTCAEISHYDTSDATKANKAGGKWKSGILQAIPTWETRIREIRVTLQGDAKVWVKTEKMLKEFTISTHIVGKPDGIACKRVACSIDGQFIELGIELGIEDITNKVVRVDMTVIPLRRA